jgi:ABC-type multidrug transport system ATPase subunit
MSGLLAARGLELRAGGRILTAGLDLQVSGGEVLAVVGPSGAGKTTLLRALALLDEPAAGQVLLDGRAPLDAPAFRRAVGYVAQRPTLLDATVGAELQRAFSYASARTRFDSARAEALLARLGLGDALGLDARGLSEGERQRVCLARTLLVDPAFLLLDEPTSALDPTAVGRVEAELSVYCAGGGGVILVSHDDGLRRRLKSREVALA